ncbi:WXG100-like domain-containing protein [Actinoallomurus rhizosphaericola]|uniref:WXG100-like domain-containing protein n=1 Tax=Actinoallomurus rhizosphaericola TaxID=2952536 RepID=UPI0020923A78|nr:hypothetical protein [Actinoallomurus rhizosphaericola]MCO5996119.1 hypothetical protein [Actinoallomurus rhizosphaericola]
MTPSLELPGWLETVLNDLGFWWPDQKEGGIYDIGQSYLNFSDHPRAHAQQADQHAQEVLSANRGQGITAFHESYQQDGGPSTNLHNASPSLVAAGAALMGVAAIVLVRKVVTTAQVASFVAEVASAVAEAVPTAGASLAEIPIFREITQRLINAAENESMNAILT